MYVQCMYEHDYDLQTNVKEKCTWHWQNFVVTLCASVAGWLDLLQENGFLWPMTIVHFVLIFNKKEFAWLIVAVVVIWLVNISWEYSKFNHLNKFQFILIDSYANDLKCKT